MAQIHMIGYKLQDLQFFNKLEKQGQVQLENNFTFSVNFAKDETRCVAKLYQCVKDKTQDANHNFFISVEMTGVISESGKYVILYNASQSYEYEKITEVLKNW